MATSTSIIIDGDLSNIDPTTLRRLYNLYQNQYKSDRVYDSKTASKKWYHKHKNDAEFMEKKRQQNYDAYHKTHVPHVFMTPEEIKIKISIRNKNNYNKKKALKNAVPATLEESVPEPEPIII